MFQKAFISETFCCCCYRILLYPSSPLPWLPSIFPFLAFFSNDWQLLLQQELKPSGSTCASKGNNTSQGRNSSYREQTAGGDKNRQAQPKAKTQRRGRAGSSAEDKPKWEKAGSSPFQAARHTGSLFFSQLHHLESPLCYPGPPKLMAADSGQRRAFGPSVSFTNGASWTRVAAAGFGKG